MRVIPILLRPVEWELANFGVLEILPQNKKPIISWTSRDEAFLEVAKGIRKAIETLPPFSLPNPGQKTKEQWREVGDSFSQAAQYRDALLAYEQLPRLDPNDAQAYVSKGDALRHLNQYEEALVAYQQALRLAPAMPQLLRERATPISTQSL